MSALREQIHEAIEGAFDPNDFGVLHYDEAIDAVLATVRRVIEAMPAEDVDAWSGYLRKSDILAVLEQP